MYITNAIESAINAYIKMFSSGCLNLFFRSHSSTSSSAMRSPVNVVKISKCKLKIDRNFQRE